MASNSKEVQHRAEQKRAGKRSRNWSIVGYPESMPENWREILSDLMVPILVSPLHDSDKNPGGELKKPHYHILLMFDTNKRAEQVREISDALNAPIPIQLNSKPGAARYLCHLDNPEKVQYDPEGVISFCGADFREACHYTTDKYSYIREMQKWCREQGVQSYAVLADFAAENNEDWFRCLCDNGTYVMKEYLKTLTWEKKD